MNKQMLAWLDRYMPSPEAAPAVLELYWRTFSKFMQQEEEHLEEEERTVLEPLKTMISKVRACIMGAAGCVCCHSGARVGPVIYGTQVVLCRHH